MAQQATVTVTNHFPAVADALLRALKRVVRDTGDELLSEARARCPVDTGHLRSTLYVSTAKGSTYGRGVIGGGALLPEVEAPYGEGLTAILGCAAPYGIYVEYGTRYMPAQPFMRPASDKVGRRYEERLRNLEALMREELR